MISNLDVLHDSSVLVWTTDPEQPCSVKSYSYAFQKYFVFIGYYIYSKIMSRGKIYIDLEGKKYILFQVEKILTEDMREHRELRNRISFIAHQVRQLEREVGSEQVQQIQDLFSLLLNPYPDEDKKSWTERLLRGVNGRQDLSFLTLRLAHFPPENIAYYLALQQQLAKTFPSEPYRPTIDLHIRGKDSDEGSDCIGILGGMGPLSDAEITQTAIGKLTGLQKNRLRMDLFSAPPPRSCWQKCKRGLDYLSRVRNFASRPHIRTIYLTSNTAHADFSNWSRRCQGKLTNMVDGVVSILGSGITETHYLIFGTREAYTKRLYPDKLDNAGISYSEVSEEHSYVLQNLIDRAKSDTVTPNDQQLLHKIIKDYKGNHSKISHVLLGCTELRLVLPDSESLQKELGITVVQTDDLFATMISEGLAKERDS